MGASACGTVVTVALALTLSIESRASCCHIDVIVARARRLFSDGSVILSCRPAAAGVRWCRR